MARAVPREVTKVHRVRVKVYPRRIGAHAPEYVAKCLGCRMKWHASNKSQRRSMFQAIQNHQRLKARMFRNRVAYELRIERLRQQDEYCLRA